MNLLLLEDADFVAADRAVLSGRRLKHLHEVHGAESGDSLRVGRLGGLMGRGTLLTLDEQHAELRVAGIVDGPNEIAHVGRGHRLAALH